MGQTWNIRCLWIHFVSVFMVLPLQDFSDQLAQALSISELVDLRLAGTRLLSISGHNQDWHQNRSELHCHILALWCSTFTFILLCLSYLHLLHKCKWPGFCWLWKNVYIEFNCTDQSGWKWYYFSFTACKVTIKSPKSHLVVWCKHLFPTLQC